MQRKAIAFTATETFVNNCLSLYEALNDAHGENAYTKEGDIIDFTLDGVDYQVVNTKGNEHYKVLVNQSLKDVPEEHLAIIAEVWSVSILDVENTITRETIRMAVTINAPSKWTLIKVFGPYVAGLIILAGGAYLTYKYVQSRG